MGFQKLDDIEINGIKITNIYRECEYYHRTSGYNYIFCFHCAIKDIDAVYNLCKQAFKEGKNHVKYDGTIGTYAIDHDEVIAIDANSNDKFKELVKIGCNYAYYVREGNDN